MPETPITPAMVRAAGQAIEACLTYGGLDIGALSRDDVARAALKAAFAARDYSVANEELKVDGRPCTYPSSHHDHQSPKLTLCRRNEDGFEVLRLNCKGARLLTWRCEHCSQRCSFAGPCDCWIPVTGMSADDIAAVLAVVTSQVRAALDKMDA